MKNYFALLLALFLALNTNAQVSGYLGKRFSIDYSFGTGFPHLKGLYTENDESATAIFKHKLSFDFVTGKSKSFGLVYKFSHANVPNDEILTGIYDYGKFINFHNHEIGPYARIYLANTLAPLGTYLQFGLNFEVIFLNNLVAYENYNYTSKNYHQFDANFRMAFGKNFIFSDRIKLGFELSSSLGVITQTRSLVNMGSPIGHNDRPGNNMGYNINYAENIFELSLNLGLLAF